MKSISSRSILTLVITSLGLIFMIPPETKLKLGIDLRGGTILVYQVDATKRPENFNIQEMVSALSKRVNPAGTLDVTLRPLGSDRIEIILPAAERDEVDQVKRNISALGKLEFRILASEKKDGTLIRQAREKFKAREAVTAPSGYQWVPIDDKARGEFASYGAVERDGAVDYVLTKIPDEKVRVTGDDLKSAAPTLDSEHMQRAVGFTFNAAGTIRFGTLTRLYKPDENDGTKYHLAILLDERVMSAPSINTPIEGGSGIIYGSFSQADVDSLVTILNAGRLPAALIPVPISEDTITATLGDDTIAKGKRAITIAVIIVPVMMLVYYMFSGLVANIALALNVIIILGFMGFTQSTFTLPGLAGLALTIGMAVDANVLIFERMREERDRGCSLMQSIRNGFDRAWYAIFDSNFTTIITGLILYWIGTDQVKGFALTLMVGLAANLFTAVFVSRLLFDIWVKKGWLTDLKMMHLIRTPNFDYVSRRFTFLAVSIVLNLLAIVITFMRGSDLLDIDFTGGTAISFRLNEGHDSSYVRDKADSPALPNVKVERLILEGESKKEGRRFLIRTTNTSQQEVREAIMDRFAGELVTAKVTNWTPPELVDAEDSPEEKKSDDQTKDDAESKPQPPGRQRTIIEMNEPFGRDSLAVRIEETMKEMLEVSEPVRHYTLSAENDSKGLATKFALETTQDIPKLIGAVNQRFERMPLFERENTFGGQVAGETQTRAILATLLSWAAIMLYLAFRFKNLSYGLAAVVSLVHDVLMSLLFVALGGWFVRLVPGMAEWFDFKIDLTVISAFLTIIGYSVNDTIVNFDRLREIRGKSPFVTAKMVNDSINQCMSRTLLTSITVIVVCFIMFVWGGAGIHAFSWAMLIGCLSGVYSTIFIAVPVMFYFEGKAPTGKAPAAVPMASATAKAR